METLLYVIFFISCLVLIIAVLLQPGKTDAGALFTSGISSAAMNPRGTQSVLSKITIGAATTFMISALLLSLPALTGNRSVLDTQAADKPATADANANANSNSNANVNSNSAAQTNVAAPPSNATSPASAPNADADKSSAADKPAAPAADDKKADPKPKD